MTPEHLYSHEIDLQTAIDQKVLLLGDAKRSQEERRATWNELQALIKSRSSQTVERMERERGLTR